MITATHEQANSLCLWHSDSQALISSMVSVLQMYITQSTRHGWGPKSSCRLPKRFVPSRTDTDLKTAMYRLLHHCLSANQRCVSKERLHSHGKDFEENFATTTPAQCKSRRCCPPVRDCASYLCCPCAAHPFSIPVGLFGWCITYHPHSILSRKHPERILLVRHVALLARVLLLRHRMCVADTESVGKKAASPLLKMLERIRGKCKHVYIL